MPHLTWCEECSDDMHMTGGGWCDCCNQEICTACLEAHRQKPENDGQDE